MVTAGRFEMVTGGEKVKVMSEYEYLGRLTGKHGEMDGDTRELAKTRLII